jgi:hypothetical protein
MLKAVAIKDITIGTRHRKELGDIPALAASIEKQGLLPKKSFLQDKEWSDRVVSEIKDLIGKYLLPAAPLPGSIIPAPMK